MTVAELIEELLRHTPSLKVCITDGYQGYCYDGYYQIRECQDDDGQAFVDIGIGGTEIK